jgi:hypothetical protein
MKVGQLIKNLQTLDPESDVYIGIVPEDGEYEWYDLDMVEPWPDNTKGPTILHPGEMVGSG